jgi:hypothetical protein
VRPNLCDVLEALLIGEQSRLERMVWNAGGIKPFSERSETASNGLFTGDRVRVEVVRSKPFLTNKRVNPLQLGQEIGVRQVLCGLRPHLL